MALEYRILGPLQVARDGTSTAITAPKERAVLLCLLLAAGRSVSAERLIDAVWGAEPPPSAAKLVQLYVSHLRRSLGPGSIVTSPGAYRIELEGALLDSTRFERLLDEARSRAGDRERAIALFGNALALWRGAAVGEGDARELIPSEALHLEDERLQCLEDRLALLVEIGDHERALPELTALCASEPLRERSRAHLMLALYRSGRQSEALAVFRDLRDTLRDRLGLEPSEELRDLERAILRHDPALAPPPAGRKRAGRLPAPPTELFGRARERLDLRLLVERADVRLISLVGAGGSGKTRLALAIADDVADVFDDGVVLVELAAVRDPDAVIPAVAAALAVPETSARPAIEVIAEAAGDRELLVVLDNVEQVASAGTELVRLLEAMPRLTLVVTSRRVLHVSGEHVFPVEPLPQEDAFALFVARANALGVTVGIDPDEAAAVRVICQRLDGLPLAIELAAARTRLLEPRQLLDRLGRALTLLVGGPRDLPARQQTLRDTLDWSIALLDQRERQALANLSIFAGGWSLEAAEDVAGAGLDLLGTLVDDSLLRRVLHDHGSRFQMLETIREFADELLGERRAELARAHAEYFVGLVEQAELAGPQQPRWLAALDRERDNLLAALDHAAGSPDPTLELRLVGGLWRFWWLRGELVEGLARLEHALARAEPTDGALVAQACRGAAGLAWNLGDAARATELALRGLETATAGGDHVVGLACHTVLGLLARDERAFDRARYHFEQSGALAAGLERANDVTTSKLNLGSVAFAAGDYATAESLWKDVLAFNRAEGVNEGIALCQLNLGLIAFRRARVPDARALFTEAEELFDELGFREHQAHAIQGIAAVDAVEGRAEQAARLLGRASRILEATGSGATTFDAALAEDAEAHARAQLGVEAFAAAFDVE